MPQRFLLQLLRALVNQGLLLSVRGASGGYCLARPADQITLLDIVDAVDTSLTPHMPVLDGLPSGVIDRIQNTLRRASDAARSELNKMTLQEMVNVTVVSHDQPI
jgi:Rrf2 family protein